MLLGITPESPGAASLQGGAGSASVFAKNPYHVRGRTLYYASSIGTEAGFADVILDQAAAFDSSHAT